MKSRGFDIPAFEESIIGSKHNTQSIVTINNIGANANISVYGSALQILGNIGENVKIEFLSDFTGRDEGTMTVRGDIQSGVIIKNVFRIAVFGKVHDNAEIHAKSDIAVVDVGNGVSLHSDFGLILTANIGNHCRITARHGEGIACNNVGEHSKLYAKDLIQCTGQKAKTASLKIGNEGCLSQLFNHKCSLFSKKDKITPSSILAELRGHQPRR